MTTFTLVHVIISLVGIASGLVVVTGLLAGRRLDGWTVIFLTTTVLTSVTGFFFQRDHILPSHIFGVISLALLALAIYARYWRGMARRWRLAYVIPAVIALYLNVFVLVVQLFLKIPAINAWAPTQTEPPFAITQVAVLLIFIVLGLRALRGSRSFASA